MGARVAAAAGERPGGRDLAYQQVRRKSFHQPRAPARSGGQFSSCRNLFTALHGVLFLSVSAAQPQTPNPAFEFARRPGPAGFLPFPLVASFFGFLERPYATPIPARPCLFSDSRGPQQYLLGPEAAYLGGGARAFSNEQSGPDCRASSY